LILRLKLKTTLRVFIPGRIEKPNGNSSTGSSLYFRIDWQNENLERVNRTIIKKYNAEIHSQATLEGGLELRRDSGFDSDKEVTII